MYIRPHYFVVGAPLAVFLRARAGEAQGVATDATQQTSEVAKVAPGATATRPYLSPLDTPCSENKTNEDQA